MWYYLARNKSFLAHLVFEIFDTRKEHALAINSIIEMSHFVHGSNSLDSRVKKIISSMAKDKQGLVPVTEFVNTTSKNPAVLFPVFDLQVK